MKIHLQSELGECGLACLAMIAGHYGHHASIRELRQKFSVSLKGITVAQLIRHADALDLSIRPLRAELSELLNVQCPCILHWDLNHFVVLQKITKSLRGRAKLTVLDPACGEKTIWLDEASHHFTGVVLEVVPTPAFVPKKVTQKIAISDLVGPVKHTFQVC